MKMTMRKKTSAVFKFRRHKQNRKIGAASTTATISSSLEKLKILKDLNKQR